MSAFTEELYPAILDFLGTSGSEEVTDPELVRVLSKEINKLIRDRGDFVKNRDKNALALQAQVAKNNLEVAKEFVGVQQGLLDIAEKNRTEQMKIMGRLQGAALKAGQAADKRLRPKQSILNAAMQQPTAADKIKYIIGLGITNEKGQRLNDVELYATLEELGRRQRLFTIEKGQVKLGPELQTPGVDSATIAGLREVVSNTAADHAEVVRNREASRKVENDAKRLVSELQNDTSLKLGVDSVRGTLDLLGQVGFKDVGEATDDVNRIAAELSDSDAQLELYDSEIESLRDRLDAASGESMDRRYGKIVSNPKFQAWADAYGFRLGSYDADTGKYFEGFDDRRAVLLFAAQQRTGGRLKVRREGRLVSLTEKGTVPAETREKLDRVAGLEEAKFYKDPDGNNFAVVGEKVFEVKDEGFSEATEENAAKFKSRLDPESDVYKDKESEEVAKIIEGLSADDETAAQLKSQFTSQILGDSTLEELQQQAKEAETGAEVFYREILPHSSDAARGIRRLQNTETGEIVEVPIETQINIVEDTPGTLGERIRNRRERLAEAGAIRQAEQRQREEGLDPFEDLSIREREKVVDAQKAVEEAQEDLSSVFQRLAQVARLRQEADASEKAGNVEDAKNRRLAAETIEGTLPDEAEQRRLQTALDVATQQQVEKTGLSDAPEPVDVGFEGDLRELGGATPVGQRSRLERFEEVMAQLGKRRGRLERRADRQPVDSIRRARSLAKLKETEDEMKAAETQMREAPRIKLSDPARESRPTGDVVTAQQEKQAQTFTIEDEEGTYEATANLDERGKPDGSYTLRDVDTGTTMDVPAGSSLSVEVESGIKNTAAKYREEAGLTGEGQILPFVQDAARETPTAFRTVGGPKAGVDARFTATQVVEEEPTAVEEEPEETETPTGEIKTTRLDRLAATVDPESSRGQRIAKRLMRRREKAFGIARDAGESAFSEPPAIEPLAAEPPAPRVPFSATDDEFITDEQTQAAAQAQREETTRAIQELAAMRRKRENSNQTDATGGM